jgi:hypothetical protein
MEGFHLIPLENINGRAEVIDNAMATSAPFEFACTLALLVLCIGSYSIWFQEKKGEEPGEWHPILPIITTLALVGLFLARDVTIVWNSELLNHTEKGGYLISLLVNVVIVVAVSRLTSRHHGGNDPFAMSILFWVMFVAYYFAIGFGSLRFGYSLLAFSMVASIYHLRPDEIFEGKEAAQLKGRFGNWMLLLGLNVIMLNLVILLTLPFFAFMIFGWLVGNSYLAWTWGQVRSEKSSEEN